jgi:amino acid adenylation domain-containing protein
MHIVQAIRRAAARVPNAIAIRSGEQYVSYAEFIQRVDGLANMLRLRGIGPGARVAVYLARSVEMMVGIFGVLASGAAYVPLDPETPAPRLQNILAHSQCSLCLSTVSGESLCKTSNIPLLNPAEWPSEGSAHQSPHTGAAYVIYTSGSTGQPKGVVIEHGSLENYLSWALAELPFVGGGVPLFGNISFDHSVTSYYPPLMKGEMVILLPPIHGGRALGSGLLHGHHYSYVKITPSHFSFLSTDERAQLGCYTNLLMFGGERLAPQLIFDARRDNTKLAIMNHYGPTETTVGCCVYRIPIRFRGAAVPIGRPIPHVKAIIRNDDLKPVKKGAHGELFIGGKALAAGYWGRPDLTAQAFAHFPGNRLTMQRWYRTGDIVRRLRNGNLEYRGRKDHQVKILGYRIEPAEIENALCLHPKVSQAVVITGNGAKAPELIAAVVASAKDTNEGELRQHARKYLPSVMVPARVIFLKKFPVNANGKLDQQSLREMAKADKPGNTGGQIEDLLEGRFCAALGLPRVQADDDFFELGGDSLATVDITQWAAAQFQIDLEISALFEFPTIRSLAARIRALLKQRDLTSEPGVSSAMPNRVILK